MTRAGRRTRALDRELARHVARADAAFAAGLSTAAEAGMRPAYRAAHDAARFGDVAAARDAAEHAESCLRRLDR